MEIYNQNNGIEKTLVINFGYNVLNCLFCNYYKRYKIENQANSKLRYQDWKKEKRIKEAKKIVDLKKVMKYSF